MLKFLRESSQITDVEIESDFIQENDYSSQISKFLREIPPNFLAFYNKRNKREMVEQHLNSLYGQERVCGKAVNIVLKRIINLARVLQSSSRRDYEDILSQSQYKLENWKKISRCQICGYKFKNHQDTSLEHVLPLSLGGTDDSSNWQLLCKKCNHAKSSLFGISSINRSFIVSDSKTFKHINLRCQLDSLPKNYRYLVMEKSNRKCQKCNNSSTNKQLFVTIKNKNEIVSFDNLITLCEVCIKTEKIKKTELI